MMGFVHHVSWRWRQASDALGLQPCAVTQSQSGNTFYYHTWRYIVVRYIGTEYSVLVAAMVRYTCTVPSRDSSLHQPPSYRKDCTKATTGQPTNVTLHTVPLYVIKAPYTLHYAWLYFAHGWGAIRGIHAAKLKYLVQSRHSSTGALPTESHTLSRRIPRFLSSEQLDKSNTKFRDQTLRRASLSSTVLPGGGSFGLGPGALSFALVEVVSLGNSLVYSIISGFPGMYFLSTSGTLTP